MDFHCIIEGRIIRHNPEAFVTAKGTTGVRFEIAHSQSYRDGNGKWVDTKGQFFDIICWGKLADQVLASFKQGDIVTVSAKRVYAMESGGFANVKIDAANISASVRFATVTPERKTRETTGTIRTADGEILPAHAPEDPWESATPAPAIEPAAA